jgi:hypothetical protein
LKKPLLDGKAICDIFEVKPGKIMKPLNEELTKFEILNPYASVEDCK